MANEVTNTNDSSVVLPVGEETVVNNGTKPIEKATDTQTTNTTDTTKKPDTQTTQVVNDNSVQQTQQIEIDGKDYILDKDGNAMDSEGKMFMSKDKIESFSKGENQTNDTIISQIQKITNVVINDETGKPIEYDPTPEGLAKRELDIINATRVNAQQEGINLFLENNPDFKSMYQYKQTHGTLEGYGTVTDYTSFTFDKTNKNQLKQFVIDEQVSKGMPLDTAKQFAEFAEKNNTLDKLGESAFNNLKNNQSEIIQSRQKQVKDWADKYYGVEVDNSGNVKDLKITGSLYDIIINKGEFSGLKLPKDGIVVKNEDGTTTKLNNKQLFEFAAYADQNGNSKMDNVINSYLSKSENKLAIALYILKGGDLSELANAAISKNQITKLKISTQNNKSTSKTFDTGNNNSKATLNLPVR